MSKNNVGTIVKIKGRFAVVLGDSISLHLDGLREKGCIGTDEFSHLTITSEDEKITNEKIVIFRRDFDMYHNFKSSNEDLLIYKYLDDDEGAKCIMLSTFLETVKGAQSVHDEHLSESAKTLDEPVFSEDL